jgi:hypothetical protein
VCRVGVQSSGRLAWQQSPSWLSFPVSAVRTEVWAPRRFCALHLLFACSVMGALMRSMGTGGMLDADICCFLGKR